ncbi:MAG: caspase family protein [Bacteroidota bacterium]|nr:caspase family protein [Bacteroidota bacterium]
MNKTTSIFAFLIIWTASITAQEPIEAVSNIGPVVIKSEDPEIDKVGPVINFTCDYRSVQTGNSFFITGYAKDPSGVLQIIIDRTVVDVDAQGRFKHRVDLLGLQNTFTVKATDKLGNNSSPETIIIQRRQQFDRTGKDRALLFAVEDYSYDKKLYNPIGDALKLETKLEDDYGFKAELLKDPKYEDIIKKLDEYEKNYLNGKWANDGQLLIFFSGHGYYGNRTGFFVPADGNPNDKYRTCITYNELREKLNEINVNHKLVIVDACYSAYFDPKFEKGGQPVFDTPGNLTSVEIEMALHRENKTYEFITSDAAGKTTPDKSQLMKYMLLGLERSKTSLVRLEILVPVYLKSASPQPYYKRMQESKSSFIFFKH